MPWPSLADVPGCCVGVGVTVDDPASCNCGNAVVVRAEVVGSAAGDGVNCCRPAIRSTAGVPPAAVAVAPG